MLVPRARTEASFVDELLPISPDTFVYSPNIEAPPPSELEIVMSVWFAFLVLAS